MSTTALALRGTFDDTGQIQDLNLCAAILENTRNGCQGGKRVGRGLTLGLGDLGQESRLSDGWKPNQRYTGISALTDVESGSSS